VSMQTVDPGEPATFEARFVNPSTGDAADPATITLAVTDPAGTTTTYTFAAAQITKVAVGHYTKAVTPNARGVWRGRWTTTGTPTVDETAYLLVGAAPRTTACDNWASVSDLDACHADLAAVDAGVKLSKLCAATDILFQLSGRRFPGLCEDTVRPCARLRAVDPPSWWRWDRAWGVCACSNEPHRQCSCSDPSEVRLGARPLLGIIEVRQDGAAVPATAYRIDDRGWLVRLDGDPWPCCQDLSKDPATDADTFQVRFVHGRQPPPSGKEAVLELAAELVKSCTGGTCRLPARAQRISRQGLEVTLVEVAGMFGDGSWRSGIAEVDQFLTAYNPRNRRRRGHVASPDVGPYVRRAGT